MTSAFCVQRSCLGCFTKYKAMRLQRLNSVRESHGSYYDSLGLTPKASQADIKKAYYNLSLKYHPDKSMGESEKFREITSAYEVLGNLKLRRLYDRGVLKVGHAPPPETVREAAEAHVSAFEAKGKQRSPTTGRTLYYNFDEWSKEHYGKVFAREEVMRKKGEAKERLAELRVGYGRLEFLTLTLVLIITMGIGSTAMNMSSNYDKPKKSR